MFEDDTIFAQSTAPGRAAIAVVRLSGTRTEDVVADLAGDLPKPRRASLRTLRDPGDGRVLDEALVLWLPKPKSFTGEDMAELQVHGGHAVVAGIIACLARQKDLRPAEPGEFSRRAFVNGRLDLTAAEGLADLIDAETVLQRDQALRQMGGALGLVYETWRQRLIGTMALVTASLDFSDEELPADLLREAKGEAAAVAAEIGGHLADQRRGERMRSGFLVAIVGPPNAGKSSLLNRLAGREAAIVSSRAGTTRDVVEVHLDLAGLPVTMADTAGLQATEDEIEAEGVRRALVRSADADLTLCVVDGANPEGLAPEARGMVEGGATLVVNKADLFGAAPLFAAQGRSVHRISCRSGQGIDGVVEEVVRQLRAGSGLAGGGGPVPLTRARHRLALEICATALGRIAELDEETLIAEELREAAVALGRITGRIDVEDILDQVFGSFCIGK